MRGRLLVGAIAAVATLTACSGGGGTQVSSGGGGSGESRVSVTTTLPPTTTTTAANAAVQFTFLDFLFEARVRGPIRAVPQIGAVSAIAGHHFYVANIEVRSLTSDRSTGVSSIAFAAILGPESLGKCHSYGELSNKYFRYVPSGRCSLGAGNGIDDGVHFANLGINGGDTARLSPGGTAIVVVYRQLPTGTDPTLLGVALDMFGRELVELNVPKS